MLVKNRQTVTRLRIPNSQRVVHSERQNKLAALPRQQPSVRKLKRATDQCVVTFQYRSTAASLRIPDSQCVVFRVFTT
jgi:hypothetical protein